MTELEILKAARGKLDDDDYWHNNASDLAEFVDCADIAHTREATGAYARQLFRDKLDAGILEIEMLEQKLAIAPLLIPL